MNKGIFLLLFIFIFSINIITIKAEDNENPNSILNQEEDKGLGEKIWEKIKNCFNVVIDFLKTTAGIIVIISVASVILLIVLSIIIYKVVKRIKDKNDNPYINFFDSSKNPNLKYDKSLNSISIIPSDINSKDSDTSVPFQAHFKQNNSYSQEITNYNSSTSNNLFNKYGSNPRITNLDSTGFTSSYDNLMDSRPEPQNVFDRTFNPNRSSSLLGEEDIKRLNGIISYKDETNSSIPSNDDISNLKLSRDIVEDKIDTQSIPNEFKELKTYRVIHKFKPHRDDELMVEKNHLLKVIKTFEDGWALCYNIKTKSKGFIPMNKLALEDEKPFESEIEQNEILTPTNTENALISNNIASSKEIINNIMKRNNMDDLEIKQQGEVNEFKLSPSSEQDKLTFKYDEGDEIEEHKIIIEDNSLSHDNSCHVVYDFTDTTASFINYPSIGVQYDSQQQYSQNSQDFGIDTYLSVRKSFIPTKSKLRSMEISNDTTDESENIDYYINNSALNNNSVSFSQQSVQNLSLNRQLFTATASGLNPNRHKRSSSQPAISSEEEFDVISKQGKNNSLGRLRSKSNGRLETEYDNRRRNMYPAGNLDVKFNNENRFGPTPGRFDNYLRSQKTLENNGGVYNGITSEEGKRNSYLAVDPRRLSLTKAEELGSNQNLNTDHRKRSIIIENDNVYYVNDRMQAYREERPQVNPVVYRNIMKTHNNINGIRGGNIRPPNADNYRGVGNLRSPPQTPLMDQRAYIQQAQIMDQRAYIQQTPVTEQRTYVQQRPYMQQVPNEQIPYDLDDTLNSNRSDPRTPRTPRTPRSEPRTPRSEPRTPRSEPRTPRTPKSPYSSFNSSYYNQDSIRSKSSNTSLKRDPPKSPYNTLTYEQY